MEYTDIDGVLRLQNGGPGLTEKEYAAIKLKVPRSGDPDIDEMIRESRRAEFAKAAFEGMLSDECEDHSPWKPEWVAERSVGFADAMLAELEKEAGK
jgi:hypothetical protein